jgi:hypothetical protein
MFKHLVDQYRNVIIAICYGKWPLWDGILKKDLFVKVTDKHDSITIWHFDSTGVRL